jgi:alpha-glucosidase
LYTSASLNESAGRYTDGHASFIQFPSGYYLSVTEAALLDYAGMYLIKKNNILQSILSPYPSDKSIKVKGKYPHESPWRVMMISKNIGDFLETDILTTISPPQRDKRYQLAQTGQNNFPWWNGNVVPDTSMPPETILLPIKYFIDFCARNNIQYHSVVEYGLHQWYVDDGVGFQPGPAFRSNYACPWPRYERSL